MFEPVLQLYNELLPGCIIVRNDSCINFAIPCFNYSTDGYIVTCSFAIHVEVMKEDYDPQVLSGLAVPPISYYGLSIDAVFPKCTYHQTL
ncbi:hypothetical protein CHS0354_021115 [Potamilus streckersoni]|uniref:Uncharacterized protein n=1 Tax=Potamilus streckersoni TaxID=2493646 RepID=A0AAE0SDB3_9BIVA|nr:hypothetical protein CHS0354_021115 [Potamilus streckersoni]